MHIKFTKNGVSREVKVGFSWAVLFFGPLAFAYRGFWSAALLTLLFAFITLGLSAFVIPFVANKWYARWLAENGWSTLEATPHSWRISNPSR